MILTDLRLIEDQGDSPVENEDIQEHHDNSSPYSVSVRDGEAVSGSDPNPDSDDDTLENAHDVGLAADADLDNPKPLNIAKDVEESERYHREH